MRKIKKIIKEVKEINEETSKKVEEIKNIQLKIEQPKKKPTKKQKQIIKENKEIITKTNTLVKEMANQKNEITKIINKATYTSKHNIKDAKKIWGTAKNIHETVKKASEIVKTANVILEKATNRQNFEIEDLFDEINEIQKQIENTKISLTIIKEKMISSLKNCNGKECYWNKGFSIKKRNDIEDKIKSLGYTEDKIEKSNEIYNILNNKSEGSVFVYGDQGSGKTKTIEIAVETGLMSKKNFGNSWAIVWGKIFSVFCTIFSQNSSQKKKSKLSIRRSKYVKINLWSIFGQRNPEDYSGMIQTAFWNNGIKQTTPLKNSVDKNVGTFAVKKLGLGESNEHKETNAETSFIFVKKALWKTLFHTISPKSEVVKRLKSTVELNTFSITHDRKKIHISFWYLFFSTLIGLALAGVFIGIYRFAGQGKELFNGDYIVFAILPFIDGAFLFDVIKMRVQLEKKYTDNDFFVDTISNLAIKKYVEKISKNRVIIIHVTESDRLFKELGDDKILIRYIAQTLAFAYEAKNIKLIFEADHAVRRELMKPFVDGGKPMADKINKLFGVSVKVDSISLSSLSKRWAIEEGTTEWYFLEQFVAMFNVRWDINILSWRTEERLKDTFNKVKGYFYTPTDNQKKDSFSSSGIGQYLKKHYIKGDFNDREWKLSFGNIFRCGIEKEFDTKDTLEWNEKETNENNSEEKPETICKYVRDIFVLNTVKFQKRINYWFSKKELALIIFIFTNPKWVVFNIGKAAESSIHMIDDEIREEILDILEANNKKEETNTLHWEERQKEIKLLEDMMDSKTVSALKDVMNVYKKSENWDDKSNKK